MPASVTKTGIINAAAALLGSSERISDIDGSSSLAKAASAAWDLTIRTMLAEHPWNFAIDRVELNAGPAPGFGYKQGFALPPDCLRVLASPADCDRDGWHGEVEGGRILSNAEAPLRVRYMSTRHIDDCARWSPHFAKAASYAIAVDMAEDLTGADAIDAKLADRAETALARAKRVDSLETHRGSQGKVRRGSEWLQGQRQPFNYWEL